MFGHHFLENLASVVLAGLDFIGEEVGGAEREQVAGFQKVFLGFRGLEPQAVPLAAAGSVERADVGQNVVERGSRVDDAVGGERHLGNI